MECAPTGQRGSLSNAAGVLVLNTDPSVTSAGVDAGCSPRPHMLRAPDIAVGNLEDKPGWAPSVPPLAVEYADTGQDEAELQKKIKEMLAEGTRHIWVVRLAESRRVEVYEPGRAVRFACAGELLHAPGILKNPIPVEALYDRRTAHRLALRNLLEREGFASIEAVKEAGRDEGIQIGRDEGLRLGRDEGLKMGRDEGLKRGHDEGVREGKAQAVLAVLASRTIPVSPAVRKRILAADVTELDRWIAHAAVVPKVHDLFEVRLN